MFSRNGASKSHHVIGSNNCYSFISKASVGKGNMLLQKIKKLVKKIKSQFIYERELE